MKTTAPSLQEWEKLYQAANEFKKLACWNWMYDNDIFAVEDPETGEKVYCCVMGSAGEHFALAAYQGSEGLEGLLLLLEGAFDDGNPDAMFMQKCLMASFEDREFLASEDRNVIKQLGLKFRGRNQWPLFRNHSPGLLPWFITSQECKFLTIILEQAIYVGRKCETEGTDFLHSNTQLSFFARVPQTENGCTTWKDTRIIAEPPAYQYISFIIEDELELKRLKTIPRKKRIVWEADTFFAPTPVGDKERPYFPKMFLLVDHQSGMLLSFHMVSNLKETGYEFINCFIDLMEKSGCRPAKILVHHEETEYLFSEICKKLEIEIEMVDNLDMVTEARNHLAGFLHNRY